MSHHETTLSLRLPAALADELEELVAAYAAHMRATIPAELPVGRITRSSVIRACISRGLPRLRAELAGQVQSSPTQPVTPAPPTPKPKPAARRKEAARRPGWPVHAPTPEEEAERDELLKVLERLDGFAANVKRGGTPPSGASVLTLLSGLPKSRVHDVRKGRTRRPDEHFRKAVREVAQLPDERIHERLAEEFGDVYRVGE